MWINSNRVVLEFESSLNLNGEGFISISSLKDPSFYIYLHTHEKNVPQPPAESGDVADSQP